MNKVILMGRLTKDPEVRYSQSAEPIAFANYALAVNRRFKREGEPDADFINIVAIGKNGEFAGKYLKKGMMICVSGSLRIRTYDDNTGQKRWVTEVVVEEQDFAESKASFEASQNARMTQNNYQSQPPMGYSQQPTGYPQQSTGFAQPPTGYPPQQPTGFAAISESVDDDDLPF